MIQVILFHLHFSSQLYKICIESSLQHSESQSHSFKKWAFVMNGPILKLVNPFIVLSR